MDLPVAPRRKWLASIPNLSQLCRLAGWIGVTAICIISVVPGAERPHTGAPGQVEHLLAYAITAGALGFGYPRRWLVIITALAALSAVLEIVQLIVPGRHSEARDVIASTCGAAAGVVTATFFASRRKMGTPTLS